MTIARGTWDIYRKISGVWTSIGTIYRPNANLALNKTSTQTKVQLSDGSYGYMVPETKYHNDSLTFSWGYLPKSFNDVIDEYVIYLYDLKIVDHNGTIYYGRFVNSKATWLVGEEDKYDITAEFEIMPNLA